MNQLLIYGPVEIRKCLPFFSGRPKHAYQTLFSNHTKYKKSARVFVSNTSTPNSTEFFRLARSLSQATRTTSRASLPSHTLELSQTSVRNCFHWSCRVSWLYCKYLCMNTCVRSTTYGGRTLCSRPLNQYKTHRAQKITAPEGNDPPAVS